MFFNTTILESKRNPRYCCPILVISDSKQQTDLFFVRHFFKNYSESSGFQTKSPPVTILCNVSISHSMYHTITYRFQCQDKVYYDWSLRYSTKITFPHIFKTLHKFVITFDPFIDSYSYVVRRFLCIRQDCGQSMCKIQCRPPYQCVLSNYSHQSTSDW